MDEMCILLVHRDGETAGQSDQHRRGNVTFSYEGEWLAKYNHTISLSLHCSAVRFAAQKSTAFFVNLLPEEAIFKDLCREARLDEADIYNFLRLFGQECAGALTVFEEGAPPSVHSAAYRDITDELEELLKKHHGMPQGSLIAETQARLSIAGAQNKLPVVLENDRFLVPENNSFAPTTAILKPTTSRFPDLHRNELFCMELARQVGLPTPDAEILQIGNYQAYVVMRYDRQREGVNIIRIHQEDFCQAMGISRLHKYEENGGPGFAACGKILLHPSLSLDQTAREMFINCSVFNYIIGNSDAHGTTYFLLYHRGNGINLARFYALVSTMAYPHMPRVFAIAISNTHRFHLI